MLSIWKLFSLATAEGRQVLLEMQHDSNNNNHWQSLKYLVGSKIY